MRKKTGLATIAVFTAMAFSCNQGNQKTVETATAEDAATREWISLFDGQSLAGWHGFNKGDAVVDNWIVEDGVLTCLGKTGGADIGGDIVTDASFGNFELEWEWKISEGGNSGLMYHVVEDQKYKAPYETGPEYQLIDDIGFPGTLENWQQAGANYAMNPADNAKKELNPVGEWNSSKIVYNNGHVEHWLNGQKIVEFQEGTPEWNKEKTEGKWKDFPDYKIANKGKVALQDHGDQAWFRNIRIKELP
ncbi:DUF1080 domain-containing protein [Parapedobacter sp. ISTM3]|uniref:3-keto-disaccharide hydrolase n=1 Tax=Parapedobacter sp. ISTM3 TaxID=2800130 RepID=UPI001F31CE60|nr:DUF1080 domain-containing protein [Parapedobacter sp. ISTM3]